MTNVIEELQDAVQLLPKTAEVRALEETLSAAWTTSSEMLGEIGLAIRRVEASTPRLPDEVRKVFAETRFTRSERSGRRCKG